MKPERVALMPYWPARMDAEMASLYLGVSKTGFLEGVDEKTYPAPIREGRRTLWARAQLDGFVASQFGIATAKDGDSSWDDVR